MKEKVDDGFLSRGFRNIAHMAPDVLDVVVATLGNPLAGLESPIVFVAGSRDMFEEEQSPRLSDSEWETLIRDNTRKLYMAATRAG